MTAQPAFQRYLRIARESTWGASPTGVGIEYNAGGAAYSMITTSPLGALKRPEAKHRTQGAVGKRTRDQHAPVSGAHHSEGALDIPFVSSYGGLLLRTILGADSPTDTDDAEIVASTALGASPQTINSGITNPTATKYPYLEFVFDLTGAATFGATGKIDVTGTDVNSLAQTETITFGAKGAAVDFNVYSQKRWKTVTSIVITGFVAGGGSGTIVVNGITSTSHAITCADTSGSLTLEEFGDPGAGSGKAWVYNGLVIPELTLAFDAMQEEGLLVASLNLQGKYPVATTQTTNVITPLLPWPSWTAAVTKGGSPYGRIQSANIRISGLSRTFRAAVGSQNPAGKIDIGRMVEISGQLYLEDDTEEAARAGNTVGDYAFVFTSPFKTTDAAYEALTLDFDEMYFTLLDPKEDDGMIVADFTAYVKENATSNNIAATLVNAKNGAY